MPTNGVPEFGVALHTRELIRDGGEDKDFEALFEEVELAERAGFDQAWIGDMPRLSGEDRAHAEVLTTMAAMAARTTTLKVGVAPLAASLRNPLLLAQALATLDRIAAGRVLLAMSVGSAGRWAASAEVEFDACDAVFHQRAGRLSECIAIMRRLWTADEPFAYEGRYYKFPELSIRPRPMHKRSIPIFLAGIVEPAQRRIARIADGWLTSVRSIDGFMEQRERIDAYAREYGRDSSEISVALQVALHLDDDGDRARAAGLASVQMSTSNRSLSDVSPYFGSPGEVARNIRPLLDRGLVSVTGRLVSDDLMEQGRLIGELKQHLAKMLA